MNNIYIYSSNSTGKKHSKHIGVREVIPNVPVLKDTFGSSSGKKLIHFVSIK